MAVGRHSDFTSDLRLTVQLQPDCESEDNEEAECAPVSVSWEGERRNAERRHSAGPDRRLQARRPSGAPTGSAQRRQVLCAA